MTEGLIAVALAIAGLTLITLQDAGAFIKGVVWGFTLLVLLLHIAGRAVTAPERLRAAIAEVVHDWWPVMGLAIFILAGSFVARFADDIRETFLGFGIGMLFLPLVAVAVRSSARPLVFLKLLAFVYVCTVLGMLALLGAGRGPFHEEIFVGVPLGAYFLSIRPLRPGHALLGLALIGACLLSVKNTTFLLVLTTLTACTIVWIARVASGRDQLRAVTGIYFALLTLVGLIVALVAAYFQYKSQLPSGSPEYRIEMYGIAWRRFLDSPLWGSAFTDSAVTYFELYRVAVATQHLPTHSDVLDILAHGGIVGFLLWGLTAWRLMAIGWDSLRVVAAGSVSGQASGATADMRAWRWLFVASLVQVGAIVTYAFNPLLHRPSHGVVIWGVAGVMWALHRHLTDGLRQRSVRGKAVQRPVLA
ncbi:MAG TPA: O-antigen ligase family protein [Rubrivivax sp.]|nr:O-antigen ligase family protein [Rubrivivax sp.]